MAKYFQDFYLTVSIFFLFCTILKVSIQLQKFQFRKSFRISLKVKFRLSVETAGGDVWIGIGILEYVLQRHKKYLLFNFSFSVTLKRYDVF